jgi:hypothetical protein
MISIMTWLCFIPGKKKTSVPIVQEARWAPELVWMPRLEKNPLPLSGTEPPSSSPHTTLTELSGSQIHTVYSNIIPLYFTHYFLVHTDKSRTQ